MIDNYSIEYTLHDAKDARFEYRTAIKSQYTKGRKYLRRHVCSGKRFYVLTRASVQVIPEIDPCPDPCQLVRS